MGNRAKGRGVDTLLRASTVSRDHTVIIFIQALLPIAIVLAIKVMCLSNHCTIRSQKLITIANYFAGEKSNLPSLLSFHNKTGHINILQQIGKKYCSFGVLLLNDETGAKKKQSNCIRMPPRF